MDAKKLETFREILTSRAQALDGEVRESESIRADALQMSRDETEDAGDEAETRRDDEVRNAEEDRDDTERQQVAAALARITDGSYGVCEECGVDIPLARLQAQPAAALCIACQERLEQRLARAA